jgi:hypothetical protein
VWGGELQSGFQRTLIVRPHGMDTGIPSPSHRGNV